MSTPISPPVVTQTATRDLPPFVSNGLIGLRVLDIPLMPGVVLVSGFAGTHPVVQVEAAAQAPDPLCGDIGLNGVWLRTSPQQVEFVDQRYDFSCGELTTRFRFTVDGVVATVEVLTFCSRKQPTLVLQEVSVEVDAACDLSMRAIVERSRALGEQSSRTIGTPGKPAELVEGSMEWRAVGGKSEVGLAYATELVGGADAKRTVLDWGLETSLATQYELRARPGRRYRLRQISAVVPSVLHHDPGAAAMRLAARGRADGFDRLREENRIEWNEIWKGRVLIDADDDRWQALADASFFYLNNSVHPSSPSSTSIYGLAQWIDYHYYYGHVMWDIEFFSVPPLLLCQPDAARTLLEFRTNTIEAARGNAKLHGRRGLQFPWESGPYNGEEAAPGEGRASWHEDHVSPDVALGFAQYAHATGDQRFLAEDASRILYGVADWIASRVTPTRRGFEIHQTMGIAEVPEPSDNEAFTVMVTKQALREAIACAETLGHSVPAAWRQVHAGLEIRVSRDLGAVMSHDGFHPNEQKGTTPAPLAGIFPVWYPLEPRVEQATLRYFLDLAPDYVGSPMLSPLYGVWAAWAGDRRLSARLLDEGYAALVAGRFSQPLEQAPAKFPDKPKSGPFFANLGGFLMGLMYGFPAIRLGSGEPETWPSRPVVLPAGWRSIEIERAWVRGQPARIVARHGAERAVIERPGRGARRVA